MGEGLHEHDLRVRQRLKLAGLRQAVPKGRRVLIVYASQALTSVFRNAAGRSAQSIS